MGHYDEFYEEYRDLDLQRKGLKGVDIPPEPKIRREISIDCCMRLDIENSKRMIEPDAIDDHFRDLIKAFSPTIYKEMCRRDMFYHLQEVIHIVAKETGWEVEL
jgi:hypothetical protein